jgi:hypothetical protein
MVGPSEAHDVRAVCDNTILTHRNTEAFRHDQGPVRPEPAIGPRKRTAFRSRRQDGWAGTAFLDAQCPSAFETEL